MKNIVILGSTGSIGKNSLEIIDKFKDKFNVLALSANKNINLLEKQIKKFKVGMAAVYDETLAKQLQKKCRNTEIYSGTDGIKKLCAFKKCDLILNAIIGSSGLKYTVESIYNRKNIALANKESYVMAGPILNDLIRKYKVDIIPVDSEHSAIFHLIKNLDSRKDIEKIYLTASGGPFLNKPIQEFVQITIEDALKHPVWSMGGKITVDSATLINKGFEVIEAVHLFKIGYQDIDVVIHPQSIIHSMVKVIDGEIYAQLSPPDMKFPILNALSYPEKLKNPFQSLDLYKLKNLSFQKPDNNKFPLLKYSYDIGKKGGNLPAALSIADDIVVSQFLERKIRFNDIFPGIKNIVENVKYMETPDLDDILRLEKEINYRFEIY
ncbi:MAG: 1-deoxy-D-xylulose-5-phosphate reductoisomerase [Spirochaetes bacterium]|nr:1-deoxy-D-xylulose-5-phosphate reductoisomerase [Spirochaetota bacterium]